MAFKLTKAETVTRDKLAADLRVALEQVERTIRVYNDALRAARDFAEQRAAAWREQHDGRSERWQRSNTGSAGARRERRIRGAAQRAGRVIDAF